MLPSFLSHKHAAGGIDGDPGQIVAAVVAEIGNSSSAVGHFDQLTGSVTDCLCLTVSDIADRLQIPFYEDIIHCKSKQRMNAVFTISQVPSEPNIIVFDDIVTTGSTLASIKQAFEKYNKNLLFFTGINNKL